MMRHLGNVWKAAKLLSSARDLALETRHLQWEVKLPSTFFLQAEYADVNLTGHDQTQIEARLALQAGFGWQLASDQDEAGVYIVAKRKAVIGGIARAKFEIKLPRGVHVSLDLRHCQLCIADMHTAIDLPPTLLESQ